MKRIITATLVLTLGVFLFVSHAVPASALEQYVRTTSVGTKAGQIIRNGVKETVGTIKQTFRSDWGKFHSERLTRQFAVYEKRLNHIAVRIQNHIDKKRDAGKDTASAQTQLDSGKAMLVKAVASGKKAAEMFASITVDTWDVQKPEMQAAIDQAQLARREFIQAQKLMVQTIKLLRQL